MVGGQKNHVLTNMIMEALHLKTTWLSCEGMGNQKNIKSRVIYIHKYIWLVVASLLLMNLKTSIIYIKC